MVLLAIAEVFVFVIEPLIFIFTLGRFLSVQ